MKKFLLIHTVLIINFSLSLAQANWQWAFQMGSTYLPYSERGEIISDGTNAYYLGSFGGTLYITPDSIISDGFNDLFITKFDQNGGRLWTKQLGGTNAIGEYEDIHGVYDPLNNCIYIAGTFYNTINFSPTLSLSSPSDGDVFIAKMDLNGNFSWAKQGGSNMEDNAYVFIQPDGNVLISGKLGASGGFAGFPAIAAGGYFARFDTSGTCVWVAHKFSGPEPYRHSVSFIGSDMIFVGGYSQNPSYIDTATLYSNGSFDGFITRMDSVGNVKWIKSFGGSGIDGFSNSAIDLAGNIYASGAFEDTLTINGHTLITSTHDMLLAKFDGSGNNIWLQQAHITGVGSSNSMKYDTDGNIYTIGSFSDSASFGNYIVTTSDTNMFLARYDTSGECIGVRHFGNANGAFLDLDNSGNVYVCGGFKNTVTIGSQTFTAISTLNRSDIFIAKSSAITGLGGGEREANNQLIIYANPNKGTFNIKVPDDIKTLKNAVLIVYDNAGKETARFALDNQSDVPHFNVTNAVSGMYTVKLVQGEKSYTGQMVVQ